MKSKLVKGKVLIETDLVVENFYGDSPEKCVEEAFRGNILEIVLQALSNNEIKVFNCETIKDKSDVPKGWSLKSLPWLPSILFGDKKQYKENTIEKFLK